MVETNSAEPAVARRDAMASTCKHVTIAGFRPAPDRRDS